MRPIDSSQIFPTTEKKSVTFKNVMISGHFFERDINEERGGELLFVNILCETAGYENVRLGLQTIADVLERLCRGKTLCQWADRFNMDGDNMLLQQVLFAVYGNDMSIAKYLQHRREALISAEWDHRALLCDFQGCKYHWIYAVIESVENVKALNAQTKRLLTELLMRINRWCYNIPFDAAKRQQNAQDICVVVQFLIYMLSTTDIQPLFDDVAFNQYDEGEFGHNFQSLSLTNVIVAAVDSRQSVRSRTDIPESAVEHVFERDPFYASVAAVATDPDIDPFAQWICTECGARNFYEAIAGNDDGAKSKAQKLDKARICTVCRSPPHCNGDGAVVHTIKLKTDTRTVAAVVFREYQMENDTFEYEWWFPHLRIGIPLSADDGRRLNPGEAIHNNLIKRLFWKESSSTQSKSKKSKRRSICNLNNILSKLGHWPRLYPALLKRSYAGLRCDNNTNLPIERQNMIMKNQGATTVPNHLQRSCHIMEFCASRVHEFLVGSVGATKHFGRKKLNCDKSSVLHREDPYSKRPGEAKMMRQRMQNFILEFEEADWEKIQQRLVEQYDYDGYGDIDSLAEFRRMTRCKSHKTRARLRVMSALNRWWKEKNKIVDPKPRQALAVNMDDAAPNNDKKKKSDEEPTK